jgi:hypothetical protein
MYLGLGVVAENKVASGVKVAVGTELHAEIVCADKSKAPFICELSSVVCFF